MTAALRLISPFTGADAFGEGRSEEAEAIRKAQEGALFAVDARRALSAHLGALSPQARFEAAARWPDACEAMLEFLAAHYPQDLLKLVGSKALPPPVLTFAAEIAGRLTDSRAVREVLVPLLDHGSALVREGAIYGLRDHYDDAVVAKLQQMAHGDASAAIRGAAVDALDEL